MRLSNAIIIIFLLAIIAPSCIESFTPETTDYEEMLLIEGLITDNPMIHARVTISKTVPLNRDEKLSDSLGNNTLENGAIVSVICDDGNEYPFAGMGLGTYLNMGDDISLEIGKFYKLLVQTSDGEIYESDFEPYIPSPPIDSITYKPESTVISEETDLVVEGLRFYANSTSLDGKPLYLRWLLDATYKYSVPRTPIYIWEGYLERFSNTGVNVCWKDVDINGIYIGDSYGLAESRVANARLNFVSQFGDQLMHKYSLHAIQLSISESSYKFWYDLNKLINESGGLYETQPFRIKGNIICTSNPNINITGIFEVAGVSELRVFVPRPTAFNIYNKVCKMDTVGIENYPWEKVIIGSYIAEPSPGVFMTADPDCFICTLRGGTTIKPPFWE